MSLFDVCNEARFKSLQQFFSYYYIYYSTTTAARFFFFRFIHEHIGTCSEKTKTFFLHDTTTTTDDNNSHHQFSFPNTIIRFFLLRKSFSFFFSCACILMFLVYLNKVDFSSYYSFILSYSMSSYIFKSVSNKKKLILYMIIMMTEEKMHKIIEV
jgi:hypothetical protein